jgi:hypothetical protein
MQNVLVGLVGLSGLAFLLAVAGAGLATTIAGITAEGFSRACTNLALIAIALAVCFGS